MAPKPARLHCNLTDNITELNNKGWGQEEAGKTGQCGGQSRGSKMYFVSNYIQTKRASWSKESIPFNSQTIICSWCSDSMLKKQASDSNLAPRMVSLQGEIWQGGEWVSSPHSIIYFFIINWCTGILVCNLALHTSRLLRMYQPDHPIPSAIALLILN